MAGMFSGKQVKVTVRTAAADGNGPKLTYRWEAEGGSDTAIIEELVRNDAACWAADGPDAACALVAAAHGSEAFMRMTSQLAETDGKLVGYALMVQMRAGARTYPLLLGASQAPDAPDGTAAQLVANIAGTARSGFYSAFFALGPALDTVRKACRTKPVSADELGLELPDCLVEKELTAFELVRSGLDDCRGAVVLDDPVEAALR